MSWRRAGAYFALFIGLVAYYAVTEPRGGADAPAVPQRRSFLSVASGDVRTVAIEHAGARIHCVRDGERWRVDDPPTTQAPSDLIAALVEQLTTQPDVEVVDESGQRAAQFGLIPPVARVIMTLADGRTIGLALGARNPGQTAVYGQVDGEVRVLLLGLNVLYYEELIVQAAGLATG